MFFRLTDGRFPILKDLEVTKIPLLGETELKKTVRTCQEAGPQKQTIIFQPSIFRWKVLALFLFFVFLVLCSQRLGRLSGQFQHCGFSGGSRAFARKRGQNGDGGLKTHPGHVRPNQHKNST